MQKHAIIDIEQRGSCRHFDYDYATRFYNAEQLGHGCFILLDVFKHIEENDDVGKSIGKWASSQIEPKQGDTRQLSPKALERAKRIIGAHDDMSRQLLHQVAQEKARRAADLQNDAR